MRFPDPSSYSDQEAVLYSQIETAFSSTVPPDPPSVFHGQGVVEDETEFFQSRTWKEILSSREELFSSGVEITCLTNSEFAYYLPALMLSSLGSHHETDLPSYVEEILVGQSIDELASNLTRDQVITVALYLNYRIQGFVLPQHWSEAEIYERDMALLTKATTQWLSILLPPGAPSGCLMPPDG